MYIVSLAAGRVGPLFLTTQIFNRISYYSCMNSVCPRNHRNVHETVVRACGDVIRPCCDISMGLGLRITVRPLYMYEAPGKRNFNSE